jgi:hypothetical protein
MKTSAELKAQAQELKEQVAAAQAEIKNLQDEARKQDIAERAAKEKAEADASYAACRALGDLAGLNDAQHNFVYALAYEKGRPHGYSEVESRYEDLVQLVRSGRYEDLVQLVRSALNASDAMVIQTRGL